MNIGTIIGRVKSLGYRISTEGNKLIYQFIGTDVPNEKEAKQLLQNLKENKQAIIDYLKIETEDLQQKINHNDDKWTGNLEEHPLVKYALNLFEGKIISIKSGNAMPNKETQ